MHWPISCTPHQQVVAQQFGCVSQNCHFTFLPPHSRLGLIHNSIVIHFGWLKCSSYRATYLPVAMERQLSQSNYVECYVFVDHSNLWIEGQKAQKVKDVDHDPRYRVDLGKFLTIITKNRQLSKAFLYGSVPPPNDSVWGLVCWGAEMRGKFVLWVHWLKALQQSPGGPDEDLQGSQK